MLQVAALAIPLRVSAELPQEVKTRGAGVILRHELTSLPAYLDTLLPRDQSPSATDLGVHYRLASQALEVPNYIELLKIGCEWLDGSAGDAGPFSALPTHGRERLAKVLDEAPLGSNQKLFFTRTLNDAMGFYYAHPGSWSDLNFAGPPQPRGFPDAGLPPRG